MKNFKTIFMSIITFFLIFFTIFFLFYAFRQRNVIANEYNNAKELLKSHNYTEAIKILETLQDYKDGAELFELANNEKKYMEGLNLLAQKEYKQAASIFEEIKDFKDSTAKFNEATYNLGIEYYINKDYENAKKIFIELDDYLDSEFYLAQIEIKNIVLVNNCVGFSLSPFYGTQKVIAYDYPMKCEVIIT